MSICMVPKKIEKLTFAGFMKATLENRVLVNDKGDGSCPESEFNSQL